MLRHGMLRTVLRWMVGVLFVWAALSKLANPTEFLTGLIAYQLPFPRAFLEWIAVGLPWVELLCGLLLVANLWTDAALLCIGGLLAVFVIATGQAWARGLDISCGCFDLSIFGLGQNQRELVRFLESPVFAFFRNLLLTGIAVALWLPAWQALKSQTGLSAIAAKPAQVREGTASSSIPSTQPVPAQNFKRRKKGRR